MLHPADPNEPLHLGPSGLLGSAVLSKNTEQNEQVPSSDAAAQMEQFRWSRMVWFLVVGAVFVIGVVILEKYL